MGKNSRERKAAKLAEIHQEQQAIQERRQAQLAPAYRFARRLLFTLTATVLLLYVGVFVTHHLPTIISHWLGKGSS